MSAYHEMIESECPPGLAALPHFRTKNLWSIFDADRVVHVLLDTDAPGETPPLRIGARGDDDVGVPCGEGGAARRVHAGDLGEGGVGAQDLRLVLRSRRNPSLKPARLP